MCVNGSAAIACSIEAASPAQSAVKSLLPRRSASIRRGTGTAIAVGNMGASPEIRPISHVSRFTKTRAGRTVNTFVRTVASAPAYRNASRYSGGVPFLMHWWRRFTSSRPERHHRHQKFRPSRSYKIDTGNCFGGFAPRCDPVVGAETTSIMLSTVSHWVAIRFKDLLAILIKFHAEPTEGQCL